MSAAERKQLINNNPRFTFCRLGSAPAHRPFPSISPPLWYPTHAHPRPHCRRCWVVGLSVLQLRCVDVPSFGLECALIGLDRISVVWFGWSAFGYARDVCSLGHGVVPLDTRRYVSFYSALHRAWSSVGQQQHPPGRSRHLPSWCVALARVHKYVVLIGLCCLP